MRTAAAVMAAGMWSLVAALPGAAQAPPAPVAVPAAADYATERFADPWDFAGPSDVLVDNGPTGGWTDLRVEGGAVRGGVERSAWLSLVHPGIPGALYVGREGPAAPIDADRFPAVSLHLYFSGRTAAGVFWDACTADEGDREPPCRGEVGFIAETGWHTYDLDLAAMSAGQEHPWAGQIVALRLSIGPPEPIDVVVDWARVHERSSVPPWTWTTGAEDRVAWSVDAAPAHAAAGGPLPERADGTAVFDPAAFPPGRYRFARTSLGATSDLGVTVLVDQPPVPLLVDPDAAGGEDYIVARTGDAWDLSEPADIASMGNVSRVRWRAGALSAANGLPARNDPFVWLRWAGRAEPRRYHRLTVRYRYEGTFDLGDIRGGGTHGRWSWRRADMDEGRFHVPETVLQSRELVTYSTVDEYTVDMTDNPVGDVMEPDMPYRDGWARSPISALRWDANEDRGPRKWTLDHVSLRADDEARGSFVVRWRNLAPQPGTTLDLYADRDAKGFDGELIAQDLPADTAGGKYRWRTRDVRPGRYWLYVVADDGTSTSRAYATGPLRVRS